MEAERIMREAYRPYVERLAELIPTVPATLRGFHPERAGSRGRPGLEFGSYERIQLVEVAQLVPAELVAPPGPSYRRNRGRCFPVGEYGDAYAARLAAGYSLATYFQPYLSSAADDCRAELRGLLPRSSDLTEKKITHAPPSEAAMFGVMSIVQACGQLTPYRVSGYDDPYELLRAIPTDVFVELSQRAPMMVIGPMTNQAMFFAGLVLEVNHGTVMMSSDLRNFLVSEQRAYYADVNATESDPIVQRTGRHTTEVRGCPVDFTPLIKPTVDWILAGRDTEMSLAVAPE